MYSISDLRLIYTLLNHEWNLLIHGEKNETWPERFLSWLHHFKLYMWELMGYVIPYTRGYYVLALIVIMGLGIIFAIYEIMGRFLRLDFLKRLYEKQMDTDREAALISEDKHETRSRQESQLVETVSETGITFCTLTAIVKPTVRTVTEMLKIAQEPNRELKFYHRLDSYYCTPICIVEIQQDSRNDATGQDAGIGTSTGKMSVLTILKDAMKLSICDKNTFDMLNPKMNFNRLEEEISEIDLTSSIATPKCSSSLNVLTSRDSINYDLDLTRTTNFFENANKSEANSLDDSISVCDAEDVMSIIQDETKNRTSQYEEISVCEVLLSPFIPQAKCENQNSSYVLGHFERKLPELDFSPITDIQNPNSINPSRYQESYGECESHEKRIVKCAHNMKENSSVRLDELKILNEPREEYRKDQSDSSTPSRRSSHRSRSLSKKTPSSISRRTESASQIFTEEHRHSCDVSQLQSRIPRRSPSVEPAIRTTTNQFKKWPNQLFTSRKLIRKLCCTSVANVTFTPESGSKIPIPMRSFRWNNSNIPSDLSSPIRTYEDSTNITDNSMIESSPVVAIEKPYTQSKKENLSLIESCISRRYNVARLQDGRKDKKDEIPLRNESEAPQQCYSAQNPRQIVTCERKLGKTSCSRQLQNLMAVRYGESEVTQIPRRSCTRESRTRSSDSSLNSVSSLKM